MRKLLLILTCLLLVSIFGIGFLVEAEEEVGVESIEARHTGIDSSVLVAEVKGDEVEEVVFRWGESINDLNREARTEVVDNLATFELSQLSEETIYYFYPEIPGEDEAGDTISFKTAYQEDYNYSGEVLTSNLSEISKIEVRMFGAGGGDGDSPQSNGGSGGYFEGSFNVSEMDELEIWVGEAGSQGGPGGWGRSSGGQGNSTAGSGGGSTEILADGNFLAAADGGGGAGDHIHPAHGYPRNDGGGGGAGGSGYQDGESPLPPRSEGFGGDGGSEESGRISGLPGGQSFNDNYLVGNYSQEEGSGSRAMEDGSVEIIYYFSPKEPTEFEVADKSYNYIELKWTRGLNGSKTRLERNDSPEWNKGEGDLLYEGVKNKHIDYGLDSGTEYFYRAWTYNKELDDWSKSTVKSSTTDSAQEPGFPENFTVYENEQNQAELSWSPPESDGGEEVTGYLIEKMTNEGWAHLGTTYSDSRIYIDSDVEEGTEYQYRVAAENSIGASSFSDAQSVLISGEDIPDRPSNFKAETISHQNIEVEWTAEDIVRLERNSVENWSRGEGEFLYEGQEDIFSDQGLSADTQYFYKAWVYDSEDDLWSQPESAEARTNPPTVPESPSGISVYTIDYNRIDVTWSEPESDGGAEIEEYIIERSTNEEEWVQAGRVDSSSSTYSDSELNESTQYFYRIKAKNKVGYSDFSESGSATTLDNYTYSYQFTGEPISVDVSDFFVIDIEIFGAGGGAGDSFGYYGGSGGYFEGSFNVSEMDELEIWVGEAGSQGGPGGWGRSSGGQGDSTAGSGGGSTEILADGNFLAAADGGGGAGDHIHSVHGYPRNDGGGGGSGGSGYQDGESPLPPRSEGFGGDGGSEETTVDGNPGGVYYNEDYLLDEQVWSQEVGGGNGSGEDGMVVIHYNPDTEPLRVETLEPEEVRTTEAVFRGELVDSGIVDGAEVRFEYGKSSNNLDKETETKTIGEGRFSEQITNLEPDTRYYYRAVGENLTGFSTGSILSFTTESLIIRTEPAEDYTGREGKNVVLGGSLLSLGGSPEVDIYFEIGKEGDLEKIEESEKRLSEEGFFYHQHTFEEPQFGETFYYRAVAEDDLERVEGGLENFTISESQGRIWINYHGQEKIIEISETGKVELIN